MWKVIPGRPRAWYRPDCRQERKIKHDKEFKEHKRSGKVISNGSIIKCEICGKEIVKNGGLQCFCDECAANHSKKLIMSNHFGGKKWVSNINHDGKQYRIVRTNDKSIAIQSRKETESMTITGIDDIYRLREKYKNILHK